MMKLVTLASVVALSTAAQDIYKWNRNNDWSTASNWEGGQQPTGKVDLSAGCGISGFGSEGGVIALDQDASVGSIILPTDGELQLKEGFTITLTGDEGTGDGQWKCKDQADLLASCSDNYLVKRGNKWEQAERPPCFDDVVQVSEDSATSIIWGPGQLIHSFDLLTVNKNNEEQVSSSYRSQSQLKALDDANPRTFQGPVPRLNELASCGGALQCQMMCFDSCPAQEIDSYDSREEYLALPGDVQDQIQEDAENRRTNAIEMNGKLFKSMDNAKGDLRQAAKELQKEWDDSHKTDWTLEFQEKVKVDFKVTANDLANLRTLANVGSDHENHYITHFLTKKTVQKTIDYFNSAADGKKFSDNEEKKPLILDENLWDSIDGGRRLRRAGHIKSMKTTVSDFITFDANKAIGEFSDSTARFEGFEKWGAEAADSALDFDAAPGAFVLSGVEIKLDQRKYTQNSVTKTKTAEGILKASLSYTLIRMALFARSENLREAIHNRPTTTLSPTNQPTKFPTKAPTDAPSTTPTSAPTKVDVLAANLIPIAAGGGGGLLLIIIIIVLAVCLASGGGKKGDRADRNVVAFENPMYDDPKQGEKGATTNTTQVGDLYDEPSFNSTDKQNPMYTSNEEVSNEEVATGGGYLDVQPDDDEDDDDDDE